MSDPVIAVGRQFRVALTDATAVIEAKLSDDRWNVSWSNTPQWAICTSVAILGWLKNCDWVALDSASDWKRREYEAPKLEPAGTVPAAELAQLRDARELVWWRTQFSTRFPAGELPAPGTSLMGKRYHLSEGEHDPGASLHVGIDLGGVSETILTVVENGKVLAFARMANLTEMYQLGEACRPYEATVYETLDREIRAIADIFVRTVAYRERLLCLGNCGESVEKRPGEVSWVCAKCSRTRQRQVPIADQRWTPRPNAPSACCRIGGEMALDGKPCPLHREPWSPEFDTLDFLKP